MTSAYLDMVKDAVYPKKGVPLKKGNKFLAIIEPKELSSDDIVKLRKKLRLTVSMFALILAVSEKTVEAWEKGRNTPSGPALRLMNMLSSYPDILVETRTITDAIPSGGKGRKL